MHQNCLDVQMINHKTLGLVRVRFPSSGPVEPHGKQSPVVTDKVDEGKI